MKRKVTVYKDEELIHRVKRIAEQREISISQLIEATLGEISEPVIGDEEELPPILKRLVGAFGRSEVDVEDYYVSGGKV